MSDATLGHVKMCLSRQKQRVQSLATDVVVPFLVVEVWTLALTMVIWLVGFVAVTSVPT